MTANNFNLKKIKNYKSHISIVFEASLSIMQILSDLNPKVEGSHNFKMHYNYKGHINIVFYQTNFVLQNMVKQF